MPQPRPGIAKYSSILKDKNFKRYSTLNILDSFEVLQ